MILLRTLRVDDFKSLREIGLAIPDRATILVQGLNEAGKSSLFEAIYFALYGDCLVKDGTLDSVIRYGADEARVELTLAVAETELTIRRAIRRGRPNQAWLHVTRPGEPTEVVTRLTAVNQRIVAELGNLDGSALLNSCFVEQKRLERLEDLSAADRLAALLKLLNLDRLSALGQRYRVTGADELALDRTRSRRELAEWRAVVPEATAAVERLDRSIASFDLETSLRAAAAAAAEATAAAADRSSAAADHAALGEQLAEADRLAEAQATVERIADRSRALDELTTVATDALARLAELDRLADAVIPAWAERQTRLEDLATAIDRRDHAAAEAADRRRAAADFHQRADRLDELTAAIARDRAAAATDRAEADRLRHRRDVERPELAARLADLDDVNQRLAALTREREAAIELQQRVREASAGQASRTIGDSGDRRIAAEAAELAARSAYATARSDHESAIERLRRARAAEAIAAWLAADPAGARAGGRPPADSDRALELQAARGWQTARAKARRDLGLAIGAGIVGLAAIAGTLLVSFALAIVAALAFVGAGLLINQWLRDQAEVQVWATDLETHRAAASARSDEPGDGPFAPVADARRPGLEAALVAAGEPVPVDRSAAEARLADLTAGLSGSVADLAEVERSADRTALETRLRWETAREALARVEQESLADLDRQTEADRLADEYREAAAAFNRHAREVMARATAIGLSLDPAAVAQAIGQTTMALTTLDLELNRLPDLETRLADLDGRLTAAEATRADLIAARPPGLDRTDDPEAIRAAARAAGLAANAADDRAAGEAAAAETLAAGLDLQPEAVQDARREVERVLSEARTQLAERPATADRLAAAEAKAAACRAAIADGRATIDRLLGADPARPAGSSIAELGRWIAARLAAVDRAALLARRGALEQAIGAAAARQSAAEDRRAAARDRIAAGLDALGAKDPPLPAARLDDRAVLLARLPDLADADPDRRDAVTASRDAAIGDRARAVQQVAELEARLDLAGVPLDADACRAEECRQTEDLAIRRRASAILARARDRLIEQVLPNTEINLRLLLPRLTAGRYHDARIGDDYRIEVWDEAAERYVVKQVFSGGARDQFSLALRLAFALATLPQEVGTTPGFLFLDEPLGSFDVDRATALIELLTTGQIAANFAQIFVITHVRGFEPRAFSHHLRLADGRVADTDLDPAPAEALF